MEYTGKLYGKIGRRLIPLTLTSEDVDRMDRERQAIEEKLAKTCDALHEFVQESSFADGTEAGHSVAHVVVQYARRYRRERDAERELADDLADAVIDLRTRLAAMGQGSAAGKGALMIWELARTIHPEISQISQDLVP